MVITLALKSVVLMLSLFTHGQVCMSTIFGFHGDRYGGRTPTVLTKKRVKPSDIGIAHRTWPMRTRVRLENIRTGLVAYGIVLDRGPYGMVDDKGWFNARREKERARNWTKIVGKHAAYRGCADITPSLAKLLDHDGYDRIRLSRIRRRRYTRKTKN